MRHWFPFLSLIFFCSLGWAQSPIKNLEDFDLRRNEINRQGMTILASWSVLNMAWSATQLRSNNGIAQSYHQMNLAWNGVNALIAGFGLYQSYNFQIESNLWSSLDEQATIKRVLAVNAALDLAYLAGGFYLREYTNRSNNPDRFEGFGRAVIVNGAFLFTFDLLLYWAHRQHELRDLVPLMQNLQLGPQSIGLRFQF